MFNGMTKLPNLLDCCGCILGLLVDKPGAMPAGMRAMSA